jgi:hypothetical protein
MAEVHALKCAAITKRGSPCKLPVKELWARVPFCWRHCPRLYYERLIGGRLTDFAGTLARIEGMLKEEGKPDGTA